MNQVDQKKKKPTTHYPKRKQNKQTSKQTKQQDKVLKGKRNLWVKLQCKVQETWKAFLQLNNTAEKIMV